MNMNEIKEWAGLLITGLGLDFLALKSGLVGSFLALAYEKKQTPRRAAVSIASGAILAGYLGPMAAQFFGMEGSTYAGACFLVGLLSMRIVPMIFARAESVILAGVTVLKNGNNGKGA